MNEIDSAIETLGKGHEKIKKLLEVFKRSRYNINCDNNYGIEMDAGGREFPVRLASVSYHLDLSVQLTKEEALAILEITE